MGDLGVIQVVESFQEADYLSIYNNFSYNIKQIQCFLNLLLLKGEESENIYIAPNVNKTHILK